MGGNVHRSGAANLFLTKAVRLNLRVWRLLSRGCAKRAWTQNASGVIPGESPLGFDTDFALLFALLVGVFDEPV